jgi:hypothetical protein
MQRLRRGWKKEGAQKELKNDNGLDQKKERMEKRKEAI